MRIICTIVFLIHFLASVDKVSAQQSLPAKKDSTENWSYHFQLTTIEQAHPAFHSAYSGMNSLQNTSENAFSLTTTLFVGRRLWKGAAFYFNPEVAGGAGLSSSTGVAGALNGETYRIGDPSPTPSVARAFLQQHIALSNSENEMQQDAANELNGKIPSSRITISAGKFAITDFFDDNKYSHDPRTQFFNWSLMSNGAWDYPANTRGYTEGIVIELIKPQWAMRISSVVPPRTANGPYMDYHIANAHSETFEVEKKLNIRNHSGTIRFLVSNTLSKAPSYATGLQALKDGDTTTLNVFTGAYEWNTYGGNKLGLGISADQELSGDIGIFARASWNDGKYATWAFTEIDQTASLGIVMKGIRWKRREDVFGIAMVMNGISNDHRHFLNAGGYGFIIGDGKLTNYNSESIIETYYSALITPTIWATVDYQFVNNPGYNMDRGPVSVFGARVHVAF